MGFRRSLVRIQSPRQLGRLSADDSRPFLLSDTTLAAGRSEVAPVTEWTAADGDCPELSAVGASVGASVRAPPSVPVAWIAPSSAWLIAKASDGRASRAPRTSSSFGSV